MPTIVAILRTLVPITNIIRFEFMAVPQVTVS